MELSMKSKIQMTLAYLAIIAIFVGSLFLPDFSGYGLLGVMLMWAGREIWFHFTWRCDTCNKPLPSSVGQRKLRFCPYCGQEYECEA